MTSDESYDAYIADCMKQCRCCVDCQDVPCGGTLQGAGCDQFRCTCYVDVYDVDYDDDYIDDTEI